MFRQNELTNEAVQAIIGIAANKIIVYSKSSRLIVIYCSLLLT